MASVVNAGLIKARSGPTAAGSAWSRPVDHLAWRAGDLRLDRIRAEIWLHDLRQVGVGV